MKLSDLSDINRRILVVLKDIHCAGRRHIADLAGLQPNQVSPALNRLEGMGFIDHPVGPGTGWTMSEAGYALFGLQPPVVSEFAPEPEQVAEPEPDIEAATEAMQKIFDANALEAAELDWALADYRARLAQPSIPARAARVYRELLAPLPNVLVEALAPITALVDAHG